jgi:hypothetical protein
MKVNTFVIFHGNPTLYRVVRVYHELIPDTSVKEVMLELWTDADEGYTRRVGHMDRDADRIRVVAVPPEDEKPSKVVDSCAFDMMLAGCSIESKMVFTIHVNQYAVQNIKELPGIREIGNLGAVLFTGTINAFSKSRWYVDADPSWVRFADEVLEVIRRREVQIVFFYWP